MPSSVWGVTAQPLFEFEQASVVADSVTILDEVTAAVPEQGITAVVGPSGAGKSTLLRLCNRLAVPTEGWIMFRGTDIADLDPLELRRTVGMVFQRPTVFAGTVRENLEVAAPDLDRAAYTAALEEAALGPDLLGRAAQDLSGGEAQRVCLVRSLLAEPQVLLMDEPTSAVDGAARDAIESRVCRLRSDGIPVVLVTHDLEQMRRLSDHVIVLIDGRVRATGPLPELGEVADPGVRRFLRGAGT